MKLKSMAWAAGMFCALTAGAQAQIIPGAVQLTTDITGTRTLSADSVYQISALVKVQSGGVLNIPAGTLIYGNNLGTQNAIQVQVGGRLNATGTVNAPIIFASAATQGSRAPGDWAGIVMLGDAPINVAGGTNVIEGGTGGSYGGTDAADNSGTLNYVRIEYAGSVFSPNNELNSLTLGGVGTGTTIDYVQTSYGKDDAFEWFGGTVNAKHLVSLGTLDDDFDTDLGWVGSAQYMFALRDITKSDVSTSNGMEADNDGTGTGATPLSYPKFANMTMVGPFYDGSATTGIFGRAGHWRRNTRYNLYNSVLTGFATGLLLDGAGIGTLISGAAACPQPATLELKGTVITAPTVINVAGGVVAADANNWLNCAGAGNTTSTTYNVAALTAVGQANLTDPDGRPAAGSPAVTGGVTLPGSFPAGSVSTTYRGAFDPATARSAQWDAGWTNYNPQLTTYVKFKTGWNLVALANTPSDNSKDAVFPNNASNAFRYNAGYAIDNNLDAGVGYWVKLASNATNEQTGATVALPSNTTVVDGWNIVSTGASSRATASATTAGGGASFPGAPQFFGFDPSAGYFVATVLEPGKAYWVKVNGAGTLTFNN